MKVLITGASGLVGTALTKKLLQKGHEVNYLTTSDPKSAKQKLPGANGFFWNPAKEVLDEACFDGVDSIVHLAGANLNHRWTKSYKKEIIESRVLTAQLLFNRLKDSGEVKQFISASGVSIYKDSLTEIYTEENYQEDDGFLAVVVRKWEAAADRFRQLGLKVAKIRTGPALAKESGMLKELERPVKFGMGSALGTGKQWISWIHIEDLVAIYVAAIEQKWEGVFNATAPFAVTNEAMMEELSKKMKKPRLVKKAPEFVIKLIFGEMSDMLLDSQHARPEQAQKAGYKFRYPTLTEALDDLVK